MGGRNSEDVLSDPEHAAIAAQLHEYAAALALGVADLAPYAPVTTHLEHCVDCQTTLALLRDLAETAYAGVAPLAARRPRWRIAAPPPEAVGPLWQRGGLGQLVVQFSEAWLRANSRVALAAVRGEDRYRYELPTADVPPLRLTIEIAPDEADPSIIQVEVQVDDGDRPPLDQGGAQVTILAGERSWMDETDATGCATFADIPATALAALRVEIAPPRGRLG